QLTLLITPADSAYDCPDRDAGAIPVVADLPTPKSQDDERSSMEMPWRYQQEFLGVPEPAERDYEAPWRDRDNPCRPGYYMWGYNDKVQAQRNLLATDLGLLAKSDALGRLLVTVTSLAT